MAATERRAEIFHEQVQQARDAAGLHRETAVHISLTECELRIEQHRPFGGLGGHANGDGWLLDNPDLVNAAIRIDERQVTLMDDFS